MRGYLERGSPRGQPEGPKREGIYYYMGAFMLNSLIRWCPSAYKSLILKQRWRPQRRSKRNSRTSVWIGKTEVALEDKTSECSQLAAENTTLQAKVQELMAALASKEQEMTTQAANFKVTEEKLNEEAATGFADGFGEALVQAACANPDIDISGCSPLNEVVDDKIVPLEASEE